MATYYWVGGAATWDSTTTTPWATSSGGAGSAGVPTSADDVVFDANAGGGGSPFTITLGSNPTCKSLTCTATPSSAYITLGGSGQIGCYGSINAPGNIVCTGSQGFAMLATTTGWTINLQSTQVINFNGVGGGWTLAAAFSATSSTWTVTNGSFNTGGYALSIGSLIANVGTATRSITLGTSTITVNSNQWLMGTTGLTVSAASATVVIAGNNTTLTGGGNTYGTLTINAAAGISNLSDSNTFTTMTVGAMTLQTPRIISFGANQTIGTLTVAAGTNASTRRQFLSTVVGTQRTLAITTMTAGASYVDWTDIAITGTASPISGTSFGDGQGNSGITMATAKNVYWSLAAGGTWAATAWATSSGGAPSLANFPLVQDTVIFDNTGLTSGNSVAGPNGYLCSGIDFSARTNAMTFTSVATTMLGNFTGGSGVTWTGTNVLNLAGRSGTQTLSCNGMTMDIPITVNAPGATVQLTSTLTMGSTRLLTLTAGTLDMNGFSISAGSFSSTNSNTRSLKYGSGTMTLAATGTVFTTTTSTGLTVTGQTTGKVSLTGGAASTFSGGGASHPTLNLGGAGPFTITGSNTFYNITNTVQPTTLKFTAATTTTLTLLGLAGTSGNLVTIDSVTAATHTLSCSSGVISLNYCSLAHSIATGGTNFRAYTLNGDVDGGSNTGWVFSPPWISSAVGLGSAGAVVSPFSPAGAVAIGVVAAGVESDAKTPSAAAGTGLANANVVSPQSILIGAAGIGVAQAPTSSETDGTNSAQAVGVANANLTLASVLVSGQAVAIGVANANLTLASVLVSGQAVAIGVANANLTLASVLVSGQAVAIGVANANLALASVLVSGQAVAIGVARAPTSSETDGTNSAQAVGVANANLALASVSIPIGQAAGTGSANAVTTITIPLTQAVAGQAVGIGVAQAPTSSETDGTNSAQAVGVANANLTLASVLVSGQAVAIGVANANLTLASVLVSGQAVAIGVAQAPTSSETDGTNSAQAVGVANANLTLASVSIPIGQAAGVGTVNNASPANLIRNPDASGASVGTPGTLPTNASAPTGFTGMTTNVTGFGVEFGMGYIELQFGGTNNDGGTRYPFYAPEQNSQIPMLSGQTVQTISGMRLVGGTCPPSGIFAQLTELASGAYVTSSSSGGVITSALAMQSMTYTLNGGPTVNHINLWFTWNLLNGATQNFTMRFYRPLLFRPAVTPSVSIPAAQATGVGLANANVVSTSFTDGQAAAPGVAGSVIISPTPMVIQAGGTGSANAVVDSESFAIGQAAAVGTVNLATASVAPLAVQAAGIGTVNNASPVNSIRNPQAAGASVGSPGVVPTYWVLSPCAGISTSVVALGNIGGYNYIQVNWSGTNTSGVIGYPALQFEYSAYQPAVKGQTWLASVIASMISGSMAGVTGGQAQLKMAEVDSGSGYVNNTQVGFTPSATPTLVSYSNTIAAAATAYLYSAIYMQVANGASVNVTLQFAFPSLTRPAVTPSVGILAGQAIGVGVAQPTSLMGSLVVLQAVGTGSANSITASDLAASAQATGTGSANATLETGALVSAAALGTGSANAAITSISVSASSAAALGSANSVAKSVLAGQATGVGVAQPTSLMGSLIVLQAVGTGLANSVAKSVLVGSAQAVGTGSANATLETGALVSAAALGTGSANAAITSISVSASSAAALGSANSVAKSVLVGSAQAIAVGSASTVSITEKATVVAASGTGSAHALSDAAIFTVAVAQGTGVATVGLPSVQLRANSSVGIGIARSVGTWARNSRGPRATVVKMNSTG